VSRLRREPRAVYRIYEEDDLDERPIFDEACDGEPALAEGTGVQPAFEGLDGPELERPDPTVGRAATGSDIAGARERSGEPRRGEPVSHVYAGARRGLDRLRLRRLVACAAVAIVVGALAARILTPAHAPVHSGATTRIGFAGGQAERSRRPRHLRAPLQPSAPAASERRPQQRHSSRWSWSARLVEPPPEQGDGAWMATTGLAAPSTPSATAEFGFERP
jgi:hypothetical protein